MKALKLSAPLGDVTVAEVATPTPGADEILIKVEASGLCYTDVHICDNDWAIVEPLVKRDLTLVGLTPWVLPNVATSDFTGGCDGSRTQGTIAVDGQAGALPSVDGTGSEQCLRRMQAVPTRGGEPLPSGNVDRPDTRRLARRVRCCSRRLRRSGAGWGGAGTDLWWLLVFCGANFGRRSVEADTSTSNLDGIFLIGASATPLRSTACCVGRC